MESSGSHRRARIRAGIAGATAVALAFWITRAAVRTGTMRGPLSQDRDEREPHERDLPAGQSRIRHKAERHMAADRSPDPLKEDEQVVSIETTIHQVPTPSPVTSPNGSLPSDHRALSKKKGRKANVMAITFAILAIASGSLARLLYGSAPPPDAPAEPIVVSLHGAFTGLSYFDVSLTDRDTEADEEDSFLPDGTWDLVVDYQA